MPYVNAVDIAKVYFKDCYFIAAPLPFWAKCRVCASTECEEQHSLYEVCLRFWHQKTCCDTRVGPPYYRLKLILCHLCGVQVGSLVGTGGLYGPAASHDWTVKLLRKKLKWDYHINIELICFYYENVSKICWSIFNRNNKLFFFRFPVSQMRFYWKLFLFTLANCKLSTSDLFFIICLNLRMMDFSTCESLSF